MSSRRTKITLAPEVLRWARERASLSHEELAGKVNVKPGTVEEWESTGKISFAQIDRLAARTYTPFGFLFLSKPPDESLPIADFRTRSGGQLRRPSPNLLDTIYQMQSRQWWMRDEVIEWGAEPIDAIGSFNLESDYREVARAMREFIGLQDGWASEVDTWQAAFKLLREHFEAVGVMVVVNGIVGNNTSRKLDPDEFQGFALADEYSPLVFINGADYKAAQIFTLAHEVAHLFVGESGLSKFEDLQPPNHRVEKYCNLVAAEFLVPEEELRRFWPTAESRAKPFQSVARHFKVSAIVGARRAWDLRLIDYSTFSQVFSDYRSREQDAPRSAGGDFWNLQKQRVGIEFASAVVRAVEEGRLRYTDAYSLTDLSGDVFDRLVEKLDIAL